jgi:hypothetical protein
VREKGNVEEDPFGEFTGKNHLSIVSTGRQVAEQLGRSADEVEAAWPRDAVGFLRSAAADPGPGWTTRS